MLLTIALIVLLYLMAWDSRPVAEYGLAVDRRWVRHALGGLAIGGAFYFGYCVLACAFGVYAWSTPQVDGGALVSLLVASATAIVVSVVQQIIFSGYLPSVLRRKLGIAAAVLLSSLVFGIFGGMAERDGLVSAVGGRLAVGMCAVSVLLCATRLLLGNLAFPAALLAGAMIVRRGVRKLHIFDFDPTSTWAQFVAPENDPRQGPLMWALLAVGTAITAALIWRRGEYKAPEDQPALDASFKRVMPLSNLLGLAPLDLWLAKLREARWHVGLKYVPRLVVTLSASAINTLLTLPERLLAPKLIKHEVPDPVFIVGVHRTGTTHLHNLLSLDGRYCTPRNYQVFNPHGFLTGWLTTLVLSPFLSWRRPMDAVQLSVFSPQEEDFALAAMSRYSPYWFGCFPKLFWSHERFIYPERMELKERAHWQQQVILFLRKVTWWSRKQPLLKSPYNTARVAALREMFPRAKFIHLVRHPHAVYRSNMHLAEHGWAVFQLQDADEHNSFAARFLVNYRDQESAYYRDAAKLPPESTAELRFEDLEKDPLAEIQRVYAELGLEITPQFQQRLEKYLASVANYQKNRFKPLPPEEQQKIGDAMGDFLARWGYDEGDTRRRVA